MPTTEELSHELVEQKRALDDELDKLDVERRNPLLNGEQRTEVNNSFAEVENLRSLLVLAEIRTRVEAIQQQSMRLGDLSASISTDVASLRALGERIEKVAKIVGKIADLAAKAAGGL